MVLDQHFLSFWIRFIHVISMACLLGGAVLLLVLVVDLKGGKRDEHSVWLVQTAARYEWVFWLAIGVQVITGIGNIGSFGAGLPPWNSAWGTRLTIKLLLVALFIPISLVRSIIISRLAARDLAGVVNARGIVEGASLFTALFLGVVVFMAEALAHGG